MPKLVLPSIKYKKSFLADYVNYQEPALAWDSWKKFGGKKTINKDFTGFVNFLKSQRQGKNLDAGWVPQTVFWLVEGNKFVGLLSLRHRLNKNLKKIGGHIGYEIAIKSRGKGYGNLILKLGLKKARRLGIKNALVTCDITNIRSKKIIEANGGKFASKVLHKRGLPLKLRYWLKT